MNPNAPVFSPGETYSNSVSSNSMKESDTNAFTTLRDIRVKNLNNVIIGHLNINSLRYKFQALVDLIHEHLDILIIGETKLDHTFPENQFFIPGYKMPYRLDRNRNGGGVMIYIREDIPSNILSKHNVHEKVEAIFVEINLRKNKFLLVGTYHSSSASHGTSDAIFFEQIGFALDVYSGYDKFLVAGDLNVQEGEEVLDDFLDEFHAKNLVKDPTCFKNPENPSSIDMFITNSNGSFQKTATISTGLSDFHKMIVTVMKTTYPKADPKIKHYRNFSKYNKKYFELELVRNLENKQSDTYDSFQNVFLNILDSHAPQKKKVIRANQKPYITKVMRKAIMLRSQLENKFFKEGTEIYWNALKKQRNYCNRLYKKERKNYYSNLDIKNITDNKNFWNTVKPLFGDKGGVKEKIVLIENNTIISDNTEVAQTFNNFFADTVNTLGIVENQLLLNHEIGNNTQGVEEAIKMFETHPSIISIIENVKIECSFSFTCISAEDIKKEIKKLDPKKAGTFMDIPTKQLKEVCDVVSGPLTRIWNEEIIQGKVFPAKLKLADITPIFKTLKKTFVKNYRPVSVLPIISKIFERIIDKQTDAYINKILSPFLCGYRKEFSC